VVCVIDTTSPLETLLCAPRNASNARMRGLLASRMRSLRWTRAGATILPSPAVRSLAAKQKRSAPSLMFKRRPFRPGWRFDHGHLEECRSRELIQHALRRRGRLSAAPGSSMITLHCIRIGFQRVPSFVGGTGIGSVALCYCPRQSCPSAILTTIAQLRRSSHFA
jgi:hypothetical protein